MKTTPECLPCLARHAFNLVRDITSDETEQFRLMSGVLDILAHADPVLSPPEITGVFYRKLAELAGNPLLDPYRDKKDRSTAVAWKLLDNLDQLPGYHPESFESRVRLAIAGNIIDFSIYADLTWEDALATIREAFDKPLDKNALNGLEQRLAAAHRVVYLLDNCGEAVFDRVLMEPYKHKITVAVRGLPASNDITRRELESSGLADYPVVDTGQCIPGVQLATASPEFLQAMNNADLIIAKGQGNFECLNTAPLPLVFLFMAKCPAVTALLNAQPRSLQICFNQDIS